MGNNIAEEITITPEKPESEMTLGENVDKPKEIIKKAIEHWKPHIGIAFGGGKDSLSTLSLIREIYGSVPIPVMYNDTGMHFQETYDFRDWLNVEPLERTMEKRGWKACFVGIRHDEHVARSREECVSERENGIYRVHPPFALEGRCRLGIHP